MKEKIILVCCIYCIAQCKSNGLQLAAMLLAFYVRYKNKTRKKNKNLTSILILFAFIYFVVKKRFPVTGLYIVNLNKCLLSRYQCAIMLFCYVYVINRNT